MGLIAVSAFTLDSSQNIGSATLKSPQRALENSSPALPDAIDPPCIDVDNSTDRLRRVLPERLDVHVPDVRGWNTNLFEAITSPSDSIGDDYKGDFRGVVTATYPTRESCRIPARIRISGDLKDHLAWKDYPSPVASLDVQLENESIAGMVRFKLFLPGTREHRWEILMTEVMREQGILSPRSFAVASSVNGVDVNYLFQEKLAKEMIEAHGLRESVLLEADEALFWQLPFLFQEEAVFARIINASWVERGSSSSAIGWRGVTSLVRGLGTTWHPVKLLAGGTMLPNLIRNSLLYPQSTASLTPTETFQALMLATGSWHGLRPHNRKFYFDAMTEKLDPVYYDGEPNGYWGLRSDSLRDVLQHLAAEQGAALSAEELARLEGSLQKVSSESFREHLASLGARFSGAELESWLDTTIQNLNALAALNPEVSSPDWPASPHDIFPDNSLILAFGNDLASLDLCKTMTDCRETALDPGSKDALLEGSLRMEELPVKYAGLSHDSYLNGTDPGFLPTTLDVVGAIGDAQVLASGPVEISQAAKMVVVITADDPQTRVLVRGGSLIDWTVIGRWPTSDAIPSGQRFDENLLTGCLTFVDNELSSLQVDMRGGGCEDSLNLMRATGSLAQVTIEDANQDALDLDFSDLDIGSIVIRDAGNDCVDLSSGNYSVASVALDSCTDKAVSIGEMARVAIESAEIAAADLGFAVKDSSLATVEKATVSDVDTCAAVYRKKQEFGGAALTFPRDACPKSNILVQPGSRLDYVDAIAN